MRRGLPADSDLKKEPYRLYEGVDYKEFWAGLQKRNLDELEHALVRDLLPAAGRRIVDLGCGYGRLADCYIDRFTQVIMVDGSMSLLRQAFERTRGQAIYIACDVTKLPFRTATFDAALMIRVFQHIEDSRACLSELHRLLSKSGRFVFSYCNKQNPLRVMRWFLGAHIENPFTLEPAGVGSTLISHHPKAVQGMLREAGFSNMHYYGAGVLDRIAGRMRIAGRLIAPAEYFAPFLGRSKIAPWIFCQAIAGGNTSLIDSQEIGDFLQCPGCGGSISGKKQGYHCTGCLRHYRIEDGIIDLRIN